jgi:16S rRNA processing protein RimM
VEYLKIGFIKKPHGLKGEFKVLPLTDNFIRFKKLDKVYLLINDVYELKEVQTAKIANTEVIIKLKDYNDVSEIENLRNVYIFIDKKDGVELDNWEFYSQDLVDCIVYYQNENIGIVLDLVNSGANDNLLISYKNQEVFFPFLRQFIDKIDLSNKRIDINQFDGFFD